jgi:hypothetical protein
MAFWKDGTAEPKRKFRFKATLFGQVAWYTKTFAAPSFNIDAQEVHFSDHIFKYPGKLKWEPVSVTLMDPGGDDDVVNKTLNIIRGAGYKIPTTGNATGDYDTFSKAELLLNATTDVILDILDQSGNPIETWTLHNAFIKAAKFGEFGYDGEEMREITLDFEYDWASCVLDGGDTSTLSESYFTNG